MRTPALIFRLAKIVAFHQNLVFDEGCHSKNSVKSQRNRYALNHATAHIPVDAQVVSSIERGLCVLVGVGIGWFLPESINCIDDTTKDAEALAKKILSLRVFNDEADQHMWKRSVKDVDGEILCGNPE